MISPEQTFALFSFHNLFSLADSKNLIAKTLSNYFLEKEYLLKNFLFASNFSKTLNNLFTPSATLRPRPSPPLVLLFITQLLVFFLFFSVWCSFFTIISCSQEVMQAHSNFEKLLKISHLFHSILSL